MIWLFHIFFILFLFIYLNLNLILCFLKHYLWWFFYSLNLVLCLHLAIYSHLLFNNFSGSGYIIICIFFTRHRLHLLSKDFGVFDLFNMDHWISGVKPLFFKLQKCLDRAVWCFRCSWEKEYLWLAYLIFHFMEEIPMKVFFYPQYSLLGK